MFPEVKAVFQRAGIAIAKGRQHTCGRYKNSEWKTQNPMVRWENKAMKTKQKSAETAIGSQSSNGRTVWISGAVFATCIALYVAEQNGYRIFDENVRDMQSVEAVVPSPLEILTLLAITSIGVFAGLVSLIACGTRIVRFMQRVRRDSRAAADNYANGTSNCAVHHSAS